ncbi:LysE family translocator [Alkalimarinus alittae]|uniref:LysE family transporter n=1 Tax=Alkalimarinus alittae TaxID=2961619 RepID=A0ABY6N658_9ALTE|nr:LysE family transporter [Alkalimarinus alittae]UZE97474.1 LysE family transporter [Alkalimarinus alittae]
MTLSIWLTVVSICLLGAMSPGPSLALVLKHTLNGGRQQGMITGIFHGLGVGIYAVLSVVGLAAVIHNLPNVFIAIQWGGALFLAWLGFQGLRKKATIINPQITVNNASNAARDGFLMACLNPKAAIFFIALFSQIVGPETPLIAKFIYAFTAMIIDMGWYVTVAWLFSRPKWLSGLQRYSHWLERIFGIILIALAAKIIVSA